jgi:hypothetical protein
MPSPTPRDPKIPDLVSATEAAAMLGRTRQAVQLAANEGRLLGAKVGETWVFRRAVVEKVVKDRQDDPPTGSS